MKVTMTKTVELNMHDLIKKSNATINRTVRSFCKDAGKSEEAIDNVLARIRAVKVLIRNDADSTSRMIDMRPDTEDHYRELWAACADKLLEECCMLLAAAMLPSTGAEFNEAAGVDMSSEEMDGWVSPAPKQKEEPLPLETTE